MKKLFFALPVLLLATGCPTSNPFGPAKITLSWVKQGLNFGQSGVDAYLKQKETECTAKDPTKAGTYTECMSMANKVKKYFPPAKATADKAVKAAEDAIADAEKKLITEKSCEKAHPDKNSKEYKSCVEAYKAEVVKHVKNAGCVVLTALDFLPDEWKAKAKVWIDLLKGFACSQ